MKIVLDTNVLVSAFLWGGVPSRVFGLATEPGVEILTSSVLLAELSDVLHRIRLAKQVTATGLSAAQLVQQFQRTATVVAARALAQPVARDADDDHVLACAGAGKADLIVSGDQDLLVLKAFSEIPIVSAADAIPYLLQR